jgi:hypothetical protein
MSAASSQENESKQPDPIGIAPIQKPEDFESVKPTMLGVAGTPFAAFRRLLRFAAHPGAIKRSTTIVGLVAALLAIPTGIMKMVECFNPYEMELSAGKDLTITYRPQRELVEFVFNVRAEEFGAKPNQILSATAWVEQAVTSRLLLNIFPPAFEENEARKYQPIIPNGPNPKNMRCSIVFRLDDCSREVFQSVGLCRLVVEFKARDNQMHQVPFCFNIEQVGIDLLFNSTEKQARYISEDPLCPTDQP